MRQYRSVCGDPIVVTRQLALCAVLLVAACIARAATGTYLPNSTLYPRLVRALCVDNTGGSTSPGNKVTLWGCVGNDSESWLFMDLGNGQYKLMNKASGTLMLDDTGGSTAPGTQLQIWTDNGLPPQHWVLQR
jgi:hypothetical protein